MEKKNYYEILGVSVRASAEEISAAKNALAKLYHPDANAKDGIDTTEQMQLILEAHRVLSDPEARAAYDRGISGRRPSMQTFDLHAEQNSGSRDEPTFVTYWRAADSLYELVTQSDELHRQHNRTSRLGQLAMQALGHILILKNAQIPERYWHPDIMNWLLFRWFQNRNYTTAYLLTLYDSHMKKDSGKVEMLKMKRRTARYQRSVRRLMKY